MSIGLKEKIIKLLSQKEEQPKQLTLTEAELEDLVNKRATELLDQELATLDKAFLKEVSNHMQPLSTNKTEPIKSKEERVKEVLKEDK